MNLHKSPLLSCVLLLALVLGACKTPQNTPTNPSSPTASPTAEQPVLLTGQFGYFSDFVLST